MVYRGGDRVPFRAVRFFETKFKEDWTRVRGGWVLAGVDWRSWSAADRAAAMFVQLEHANARNPEGLRQLYELAGDTAALAELDRKAMGQDSTIETTL